MNIPFAGLFLHIFTVIFKLKRRIVEKDPKCSEIYQNISFDIFIW